MRKHSISIRGHRTSFSLEDEFWLEVKAIAHQRKIPTARLITELDTLREPNQNLSSAIRVFVLNHLNQKLALTQTKNLNSI